MGVGGGDVKPECLGGGGGHGVLAEGSNFYFLIGDTVSVMRGSRKFCQRGSNYDFFFLV